MFARKCDRCGVLYENYYDVNGSAMYIFNRDDTGQALDNQVYVKDLCPDCMKELNNFLSGYYAVDREEYVDLIMARAERDMYKAQKEELEAENERFKQMKSPVVLDGEKLTEQMKEELTKKLDDVSLIDQATMDDLPFIEQEFAEKGYIIQEDGKTWTKEQLAEQIRKNTEGEKIE